MTNRFPRIAHVSDIRPHISEDAGIRFYDRLDHIQANYNFVGAATFKTPFDLECRGIVFDKDSGRNHRAAVSEVFQRRRA